VGGGMRIINGQINIHLQYIHISNFYLIAYLEYFIAF